MRSTVLATVLLAALGCRSAPSAQELTLSRLTRADSARITAAFLTGGAADSARYGTLREFFARRDSLEAARSDPRRYKNLRIF